MERWREREKGEEGEEVFLVVMELPQTDPELWQVCHRYQELWTAASVALFSQH